MTSIAVTPDGQTLVSGSYDCTVKIWQLSTGEACSTLQGPFSNTNSMISAVVITPDGQTLIVGNFGGSTDVWNLNTREKLGSLGGALLTVTPDSQTVVGAYTSIITIWKLSAFVWRRPRIEANFDPIGSLAPTPDGETIVTGHFSGDIHRWSVSTGQLLHTLKGDSHKVKAIAISPDGHTLASRSRNKTIKLWNLQTRMELCTLEGHLDDVTAVAFSPDGQTLMSGSYDKTLKV